MLACVPAGWVLGLAPSFVFSLGLWALVADAGTVLFGWWNAAPPTVMYQVIFLSMLPLGALGMVMGPRLLQAHARIASSLLAPTREEMAARVARLAESRSQVVDGSAAELRRIERAQAPRHRPAPMPAPNAISTMIPGTNTSSTCPGGKAGSQPRGSGTEVK